VWAAANPAQAAGYQERLTMTSTNKSAELTDVELEQVAGGKGRNNGGTPAGGGGGGQGGPPKKIN
jgi:hypothetical protein